MKITRKNRSRWRFAKYKKANRIGEKDRNVIHRHLTHRLTPSTCGHARRSSASTFGSIEMNSSAKRSSKSAPGRVYLVWSRRKSARPKWFCAIVLERNDGFHSFAKSLRSIRWSPIECKSKRWTGMIRRRSTSSSRNICPSASICSSARTSSSTRKVKATNRRQREQNRTI